MILECNPVVKGKEIAWKVPINCQCSGQLYAYPKEIGDGYVVYNYWCKSCDLEGPWRQLALGIMERRGDRRAFK